MRVPHSKYMTDKISQAVVRRLPKYYRYIVEQERKGIDKISSSQMSRDMGLNASQIRRDFNYFGGFGQQGYGYSVAKLKSEISRILGLNKTYNVIVIGAGKIGQALMGYQSFSTEGFNVIGVFDVMPKLIGSKIEGIEVMPVEKVGIFLSQNTVDIGIICTPKDYAQQTADVLVSHGIKGIWNFAPVDVAVRRGVSVENVHLSESLHVLSYSIHFEES